MEIKVGRKAGKDGDMKWLTIAERAKMMPDIPSSIVSDADVVRRYRIFHGKRIAVATVRRARDRANEQARYEIQHPKPGTVICHLPGTIFE